VDFYPAAFSHFFDARDWFQRADQHASCPAFRFARDVKTVMISIDEINIGASRRTKQHRSAGRVSCSRMCGRVLYAHVGFDFHDASCEASLPVIEVPNQHLTEKLTRNPARIAAEKSPIQRTGLWSLP